MVEDSHQKFIMAQAPVSGSENQIGCVRGGSLKKKKQDKQTSQSTISKHSLTALLEMFLFLRDLFHFKPHTGQDYGKIYHLFQ